MKEVYFNTRKVCSFLLWLSLLFSCHTLQAQYLFRGRVLDEVTKEPVSEAYVYLDGTSIYTTTDYDGRFELKTDARINASLVISHILYGSESIKDPFDNDIPEEIYLKESVNMMQQITVTADLHSRDEKMSAFKAEFLGSTAAGISCKILNEEVIDLSFSRVTNTLWAFASAPLIIENSYLGYRILYDLQEFYANYTSGFLTRATISNYKGTLLFVDTDPLNVRIKRRRDSQYEDSRYFLMKSFANNTLRDARITLFNGNRRINNIEDYFDISDTPPHKTISVIPGTNINTSEYFRSGTPTVTTNVVSPYSRDASESVFVVNFDFLGTVYGIIDVNHNGNTSTLVFLSPEVQVDEHGNVVEGIFYTGYLGEQRVGNLLPQDYGYNK